MCPHGKQQNLNKNEAEMRTETRLKREDTSKGENDMQNKLRGISKENARQKCLAMERKDKQLFRVSIKGQNTADTNK